MRKNLFWLLAFLTACAAPGRQQQPAQAPSPRPAAETPTPAMPPVSRPAEIAAAPVRDDRPGITVFPFVNGGSYGRDKEDFDALQVGLQEMLLTELQQNPALRTTGRSALKETLEEQNLSASGRVDPATVVQIGRLIGARYAVRGSFTDLFGTMRLDGHIMDNETAAVVRALSVTGKRENLYAMVVDLAARITAELELPPLPAATVEVRKGRNIPGEATVLYAKALDHQEQGQTDQAIELYRRIVREFPQWTEVRETLRQLTEG